MYVLCVCTPLKLFARIVRRPIKIKDFPSNFTVSASVERTYVHGVRTEVEPYTSVSIVRQRLLLIGVVRQRGEKGTSESRLPFCKKKKKVQICTRLKIKTLPSRHTSVRTNLCRAKVVLKATPTAAACVDKTSPTATVTKAARECRRRRRRRRIVVVVVVAAPGQDDQTRIVIGYRTARTAVRANVRLCTNRCWASRSSTPPSF